jgi:hypothetical protein
MYKKAVKQREKFFLLRLYNNASEVTDNKKTGKQPHSPVNHSTLHEK